jgi:hypothetical protein
MNAAVSRAQLRTVALWLRFGTERRTGIGALPAHQRGKARALNARFSRMIRHARSGR